MPKRNLTRIRVQSGVVARLPFNARATAIDGVFEVLIDEDDLGEMMARASQNRSRMSSNGPLVVRFQKMTKAQAEYWVKRLAKAPR